MSSSNYRMNKAFIEKYRKELKAMLGDISNIDVKVLNKSVNYGLNEVKKNTPIGKYSKMVEFTTKDGVHVSFTTNSTRVGGFLKKSWYVTPTKKTSKSVEKEMANKADYSSYVNYGHRVVNRKGVTVGFVKGNFMLEKAMNKVNKKLVEEFEKEVERVNRKHDK